MSGSQDPDVVPRAASTLVLLRDSPSGLQVLLTTRPKHLRFMGGAVVFPGGATSAADRDPAWERLSGRSLQDAANALGERDARSALGAFICALREAFEEVGLLLATGDTGEVSREDAEDPERFLARCSSLGLKLRTDLLTPAGRWVTPSGAPVRFDARFFVAEAAPEWVPDPDPREVERCWWATPAEALESLASGELLMAPPTIEMLQTLAGNVSVADVRASLTAAPVGSAGNIISVRLSPLVHVVVAPNPGVMTGPGTNTYIVGNDPVCIIDPAVDDDRYLAEVHAAAAGRIRAVLITHRHPDHTGGAAAVASRASCPIRAFGDEPVPGSRVDAVADGESLEVGGGRLRALHTPGHASDHLCFYLEGAASLFAGDNILGEGTAVIARPDGNMRDYLASLRLLQGLHVDRIYPGHFRPLDDGRSVIDAYLAHRRERADAVVSAVAGGASTVSDIVSQVYRDTPPHLHAIAGQQVASMLVMLEEDEVVVVSEGRWHLAGVE